MAVQLETPQETQSWLDRELAKLSGKTSLTPSQAAPEASSDYKKHPAWQPVYQGLIDRGLDRNLAAGIAANAGSESSFDPAAHNKAGGGQGAHGLFQWRGSRLDALRAEAEKRGVDPTDTDLQLDFMMMEMGGLDPQSRNIQRDTAGMSAAESGEHFRRVFERPGEDASGYARTGKYAAEIDTYLGNEENVSGKSGKLLEFAVDANQKADEITSKMFGETMSTRGGGSSAGPTSSPPSGAPTSVPADGAVEAEGGGLLDKFSSMLFPNSDDARGDFSHVLGGLGVGLGQMSAGETVDLQPYSKI